MRSTVIATKRVFMNQQTTPTKIIPLQQNEIGLDEYDELMSGDLSEVCELHARGYLVEVIAVSVGDCDLRDGDPFDGFVVASGPIDGKEWSNDALHNVTCIGGNFSRLDGSRYFAFTDDAPNDATTTVRDRAVAFAFELLTAQDLVDAV